MQYAMMYIISVLPYYLHQFYVYTKRNIRIFTFMNPAKSGYFTQSLKPPKKINVSSFFCHVNCHVHGIRHICSVAVMVFNTVLNSVSPSTGTLVLSLKKDFSKISSHYYNNM